MKNILTFTIVMFALCVTQSAHAVMRADFPDASHVQPLPQNTTPNISHNVQYSGTVAPEITVQPPTTQPIETAPTKTTPKKYSTTFALYCAGISALFVIILLIYRKRQSRTQ